MRKLLATSALAVAALSVVATTGALQASGPAPVAPPTTDPLDMLASMGLTNDQVSCLVEKGADIGAADMSALVDLMQQCGIDLMDLGVIMATVTEDSASPVEVASVATLGAETSTGAIDPASIAAVIGMIGVTIEDLSCLQAGLAPASGTDEESLAALQNCGLSLTDVLTGLITAGRLAEGDKQDDGATITSIEAVTLDSIGATAGIGDFLQQQLSSMGIDLTDDQVRCLSNNLAFTPTDDLAAMMDVFTQCGIDISDLLGG